MRPATDRLRECQGVSGVLNEHERRVVLVSQSVRESHGAVVKTVVRSGRLTGSGRDPRHTGRREVGADISAKPGRLRVVDGSCPAGPSAVRLSCRCCLCRRTCLALAPVAAAAEGSRYRDDAAESWSFLWIEPQRGCGWFWTGSRGGSRSPRRGQSHAGWVRVLWDRHRCGRHPDDGLLRLATSSNRQMVGTLNARTVGGEISQEFTWRLTERQGVSGRVRASQDVSRNESRLCLEALPASETSDTVRRMVQVLRDVQQVAADAGESRGSARPAAARHGTRITVPSRAFAGGSAGAGCSHASKNEGPR
jgi:hypothetical protein